MALIRTFYHGRMGPLEIACLKSFADHGHDVTVYAYSHDAPPSFWRQADAREICPEDQLFFYKSGFGSGSVAAFANMFRYKMLRQLGGWWIDSDVICLRPDWPDTEVVAGWQDDAEINCAVLRLPAQHPVAIDAEARCVQLGNSVKWGQTGPVLLTEVLKQHGLAAASLPPSAFYPVHCEQWLDFLDPTQTNNVRQACQQSYALHLWNERFRYGGVQKAVAPPNGSYLHELLARHDALKHFSSADERTWQRQIDLLRTMPEIASLSTLKQILRIISLRLAR